MTEGEFKTLLDLVAGDNQITIPIIQRDYAQGRSSLEDLRNNFIEYLRDHLIKNTHEPLLLDFIYGTLKEGKFTILDGQQRLTTLFLLHRYLSVLDDKTNEFSEAFSSDENRISFSYETRASSEEFCRVLIRYGFAITELSNNKLLSSSIKNMRWFMPAWTEDQTVQSMLTMLDTIHSYFNEYRGSKLYQKLIDKAIGFQFLNLDNFNLTDDLYIKMNSTGLPLTPFENFKAHLEKELKKMPPMDEIYYLEEFKQNVSLQEYFSFQMDTCWINFFWKSFEDKDKINDIVLHFFHSIFTNRYYEKAKDYSDFIQPNRDNPPLSCKQYQNYDVISLDIMLQISIFLDMVSSCTIPLADYTSIKEAFSNLCKYETAQYKERLQLYAAFRFINQHTTLQDGKFIFDKHKELKEWTRVIDNLVENTTYDNVDHYARDIKIIKELTTHSDNILTYISSNSFGGFDQTQKSEEELKARLLTSSDSDSWKKCILDIEAHPYLKGQIFFLLKIASIDDRKIQEWTQDEHQRYQNALNINYKIFNQIFNDKGLKIEISDNLWERALLSKGDYTILVGSNYSFCVDLGRDVSWKVCFQKKYTLIKSLFEDIHKNSPNLLMPIEENLNNIVNNTNFTDVAQWQKLFIKMPILFGKLGEDKRFFRQDSVQGFCLLSGQKMNSKHSELYSVAFDIKYNGYIKFNNFTWEKYQLSNTAEKNDMPCALLSLDHTAYYLAVYYYYGSINYNEDAYYYIWFVQDDEIETPIEQAYSDKLESLGFEKDGEFHHYKQENIKTMEEVIKKIEEIDNSFSRLS